ncbi:MAG: M14 family zinc carboxypeptidase [Deltaproteobacteria bacterium]|nr:M14 family zinc carboxypeptidase [Deltaproteobacteria bacterium]
MIRTKTQMLTLLALAASLAPAFDLDTVGQRSGYAKTGRIEEVAVACEKLKALGPERAACDVIGTSPEGRPLHAFTIGQRTPGKPTILVIAGIHAGEIDGKDATFLLLEELLNNKLPGVVDVVTLVFVPVYNVDGHERFGKNNRPNQRGPEEMGWRVTAQNLNLNRDWTKADAPETRALLALIEKIDPVVVADLHVTDGAQFQHDIAVIVEPLADDGANAALVPIAAALSTSLQASLKKSGHLPLDFYPSFENDDDPTSGVATGVTPARLTHGYVSRRGRLGVLVETHAWRPSKERVPATADLLRGLFTLAKTQAPIWKKAAADVDAAGIALVGQSVTLAWEVDREKKTMIDFQGYAYTREPSAISGALWTRYDETKKQIWQMPLWTTLKATTTTTAPAAYAVLPGFAAAVAERLKAHGIAFSILGATRVADVETFRADEVGFGARPYEGRMTAKTKGTWKKTPASTLPAGSLIVPVSQPRGRLVVEIFEPGAPESFVGWGFFNAAFEQKEYMEGYVAELEARAMLKDPAVRKAFNEKLASDPAFAKDPEARLDFFYRRHPAWDQRKDLLPVVRLSPQALAATK